jgi:Ca2+-binding EF-hand superfamily protein
MVDNSYHETLQRAVEAFTQLDIDQDGQITSQEIEKVMIQSGISINIEEINEIISKLDLDNSGSVDFKEFLNYFRGASSKKFSKTALWAAFKANDEDGNGMISNTRVLEILNDLGVEVTEEQTTNFFTLLDPHGIGISNYQKYEDVEILADWLF